jgi:hypothetical protein
MKKRFKGAYVLVLMSLAVTAVESNDGSVDHATLHGNAISRDAAIVVHAFDSSGAKIGKSKHADTAQRAAELAPHLLAVDIVETLRDHGFTAVTLSDSSAAENSSAMQLVGEFTEINPGSQAARAWIGFGAGASKVCVSGKLLNADGKTVGEFKDCEKGLGWGNSSTQTTGEASNIGVNIATQLNRWTK